MKHFINDKEISPINMFDIGIKVDFTATVDQNKLSVDTIRVANEGYSLIQNHLDNKGYLEGCPYRVEFGNNKQLLFAVDFTNYKDYGDKADLSLRPIKHHEQFFDDAQALSFSLVNTKVPITGFQVAYKIIPKDQVGQAITLSITVFMITMAIADQTREVSRTTKEFVVIVSYSPFPLGKAIEAGLQLAIQIAYLAILLYQAIELAKRLADLLFPKTRYLNACTIKELIEKGCQYLGYTFESTIFNKEYDRLSLIPIPVKTTTKKWYQLFQDSIPDNINKPYPTANDYNCDTLGKLIASVEQMFNAKTRVVNKKVVIERWDFWYNLAKTTIKPTFNIQNERRNVFSFDTSKLFKRYLIKYALDYTETNTTDNYDNSIIEYSQDLQSGANYDYNLIKGLTTIDIPFSRAIPKTKENWFQKEVRKMFEVIDTIAGTNYAYQVSSLGEILVTDVFFSSTKIFFWDGVKKVSVSNEDKLNAQYLWDNYHSINAIEKNQFVIYENMRIPMTETQFNDIYNLNYVLIDDVPCEILNMEYFDNKNYAILTFKQPKNILKKQPIILTKIA